MQSGQAYSKVEIVGVGTSDEHSPAGARSLKHRAATALAVLIGGLAAAATGYGIVSSADEGRRNSVLARVSRSPVVRVVGGLPHALTGILPNSEANSAGVMTLVQQKESAQVRLILQRRFKNYLRDVHVNPLSGGGWAASVEIYSNGEPEKNHELAVWAYQSLALPSSGIRQITVNLYQRQEGGAPDLLVDVETPSETDINH